MEVFPYCMKLNNCKIASLSSFLFDCYCFKGEHIGECIAALCKKEVNEYKIFALTDIRFRTCSCITQYFSIIILYSITSSAVLCCACVHVCVCDHITSHWISVY